MNEQILDTLANVAIGLAGFSGVVVAFRSTGANRWSRTELRFLWFLIGDSLLVLLFALLPFPMRLANWSDDTIWTVCSSLLGTWFIVGDILALNGERMDRKSKQLISVKLINPALYFIFVSAIAMGVALWLSAWDIGIPRGQAMYVFGLMLLLGFAAVEFLFFVALTARRQDETQ